MSEFPENSRNVSNTIVNNRNLRDSAEITGKLVTLLKIPTIF